MTNLALFTSWITYSGHITHIMAERLDPSL